MALYAIADLHLSGAQSKPMDIFGLHWDRHAERIAEDWTARVKASDTVLIPGDISWAMTLEDARPDLQWLHELPGRKILLRGNHDYWWKSIKTLNRLYEDMDFVQNNCFGYKDYAICGTRGWLCPNDAEFTEHDEKIYLRELQRLELSLKEAQKAKYSRIIVMMHYPPTNYQHEPSGFTELFKRYRVEQVVYGHLHTDAAHKLAIQGIIEGIQYFLVSCDYLNFKLKLILE